MFAWIKRLFNRKDREDLPYYGTHQYEFAINKSSYHLEELVRNPYSSKIDAHLIKPEKTDPYIVSSADKTRKQIEEAERDRLNLQSTRGKK